MQYEVKHEPFPVVEIQLADGESINCEGGAMTWMSPNLEMATSGGGLGKMFGKALSGEKLFSNTYISRGNGYIALGSSFPGRIVALEISPTNEIVLQKTAYLASTPGVELSTFFNKKATSGLFSGEGFIMQKLSGTGLAFAEFNGAIEKRTLAAGEQIVVDTGNVAAFEPTVQITAETVKGLKNKVLGGEGLFNTVLTGPGEVWLQTMPISGLAAAINPYIITS